MCIRDRSISLPKSLGLFNLSWVCRGHEICIYEQCRNDQRVRLLEVPELLSDFDVAIPLRLAQSVLQDKPLGNLSCVDDRPCGTQVIVKDMCRRFTTPLGTRRE